MFGWLAGIGWLAHILPILYGMVTTRELAYVVRCTRPSYRAVLRAVRVKLASRCSTVYRERWERVLVYLLAHPEELR